MEYGCEPNAEAIILGILLGVEEGCEPLKKFGLELIQNTSSRLFDWIDHVSIPSKDIESIVALGFKPIAHKDDLRLFHHPKAQLPLIRVDDHHPSIGISVESIEDFLMTHGMDRKIDGGYFGPLRAASLWQVGNVDIQVVERRIKSQLTPESTTSEWHTKVLDGFTLWMTRPRFGDDETLMNETEKRAKALTNLVGQEFAAWIVMKCERQYWQAKNRAGQWQKARQDHFGLGWANHDHHTFRSSRKYFRRLVDLFESLGFFCRERFYAGYEAGWGAQVMEHQNARYVLFLDVDLLEHEVNIDFAHTDLGEIPQLNTVGLWCALHGDSILSAGMHHLEAQFSFDKMRENLELNGLGMMKPFSDFPYLKQAFTKGEMWKVDPKRLDLLYKSGKITKDLRDRFEKEGAIGSHLENLERNEGYKGFNKNNVSDIIRETDPRK